MRYIQLSFDGFDWDKGNALKIQERVSPNDVEELFKHPVLIREDIAHSAAEYRFNVHSNSREEKAYEKAEKIFEKK